MGNELSTIGGAIATVGTSVAAGVTFGQVDALNNAVVECAKFTGDKASNTIVRHAGEAVGSAVAVVGTSVAAGVTFGQVDALNNAVVATANHTAKAAVATGGEVVTLADGVANGIPVVGHIKGGIHYACGDRAGGDQAIKAASRTIGVGGGAVLGILAGPAGMVAGGIAGGAAMDGITTGVESAVKGKYTPSGQIEAWTNVANASNAQEAIGGVVAGITAPIADGFAGYGAGKGVQNGYRNIRANIEDGIQRISRHTGDVRYGATSGQGTHSAGNAMVRSAGRAERSALAVGRPMGSSGVANGIPASNAIVRSAGVAEGRTVAVGRPMGADGMANGIPGRLAQTEFLGGQDYAEMIVAARHQKIGGHKYNSARFLLETNSPDSNEIQFHFRIDLTGASGCAGEEGMHVGVPTPHLQFVRYKVKVEKKRDWIDQRAAQGATEMSREDLTRIWPNYWTQLRPDDYIPLVEKRTGTSTLQRLLDNEGIRIRRNFGKVSAVKFLGWGQ